MDEVNFAENAQDIMLTVNNWVKQQTHGLIQSILSTPPRADCRAIILNAIYFKGEWLQPFSKAVNREMYFYNNGNESTAVNTTFMSKLEKYFRHKNLTIAGQEAQALEMTYDKDDLSMVILLPRQLDGLKQMMSSSDFKTDLQTFIGSINSQLERTEMNLFIPKFKIESDIALNDLLKSMGIVKAFTPGSADLSGINGESNLFVSQAKHKAVVQVDEQGTEAAAVTLFDAYPMSARWPYVPPTDFRADHPFLFLIRHRVTGLVLFMGKVEQL